MYSIYIPIIPSVDKTENAETTENIPKALDDEIEIKKIIDKGIRKESKNTASDGLGMMKKKSEPTRNLSCPDEVQPSKNSNKSQCPQHPWTMTGSIRTMQRLQIAQISLPSR